MSSRSDSELPATANDSGEDPLGWFPSEYEQTNERESAVRPAPVAPAVVRRRSVLKRAWRKARLFMVVSGAPAFDSLRALRRPTFRLPAIRLPRWRLRAMPAPAWKIPRLRLPAWRPPSWSPSAWRARVVSVTSQTSAAAKRIAARAPLSTTAAVSAFACGIIVGGSVVWLSGGSRRPGVESAPAQQPRAVSQLAIVPLVPAHTTLSAVAVKQLVVESSAPAVAPTARPRRPLFRGSLVVSSRPSGARVFLNGRSVGSTPLVLRNQAAGSRAVRVTLDGYESWSSAVQVVADTETRLSAELRVQRTVAQP
jgi:hypothetical protein